MRSKLTGREDLYTIDENFLLPQNATEFEILSVTIEGRDGKEQVVMCTERIMLDPTTDYQVCSKYFNMRISPDWKYTWRKRPLEEGDEVNPHTKTLEGEVNPHPVIFQLALWCTSETTKFLDMDWSMGYLE